MLRSVMMCHLSTIYCCDLQEDICFQGYLRHLSSSSVPAPLTTAEQQLHQIKITEVRKAQMCKSQHTTTEYLSVCLTLMSNKLMYSLTMHLTGQSGTGKCPAVNFVFKCVSTTKWIYTKLFVLFYLGRAKTSCHCKWTSKGSLSSLFALEILMLQSKKYIIFF